MQLSQDRYALFIVKINALLSSLASSMHLLQLHLQLTVSIIAPIVPVALILSQAFEEMHIFAKKCPSRGYNCVYSPQYCRTPIGVKEGLPEAALGHLQGE